MPISAGSQYTECLASRRTDACKSGHGCVGTVAAKALDLGFDFERIGSADGGAVGGVWLRATARVSPCASVYCE